MSEGVAQPQPERPEPQQPQQLPPIRRLTVLSDSGCPLCRRLRQWLEWQKQLVPLEFVEAGSAEAWARFPQLDHWRTDEEITVVADTGQVFQGAAAWIACLWALADHRVTAHRLATPAGAPLARAVVLAAAKRRKALKNRTAGGGGGTGPVAATARGAAAATGTSPAVPPGAAVPPGGAVHRPAVYGVHERNASCSEECRSWAG